MNANSLLHTTAAQSQVEIHDLNHQPYEPVWRSMQEYTANRNAGSPDLIWRVEHDPIYTLGQNGDPSHLLESVDIPVLRVDRGGQITYHGPGQLVIYLLIDYRRRQCGIKSLVTLIEDSIIDLLIHFKIHAHKLNGAPGVYVDNKKIAALGLRAKKNGCYHGLSLNLDMDLKPFEAINPCGYQNLEVTQLKDYGVQCSMNEIANDLTAILIKKLATQFPINLS